MANYEKEKDVFIQRKKTHGFEEYPLIVQPNSILVTNAANDLTMIDTASFLDNLPIQNYAYSSSLATTASVALTAITSTSSLTATSASYVVTASYVLNGGGSGGISSSWASQSLSSSYSDFALDSENASQAIFAITASQADVALSSSYATTTTRATTATTATSSISSSYAISASNAIGMIKNGLNDGLVSITTTSSNAEIDFTTVGPSSPINIQSNTAITTHTTGRNAVSSTTNVKVGDLNGYVTGTHVDIDVGNQTVSVVSGSFISEVTSSAQILVSKTLSGDDDLLITGRNNGSGDYPATIAVKGSVVDFGGDLTLMAGASNTIAGKLTMGVENGSYICVRGVDFDIATSQVGINTLDPKALLHVNGTFSSSNATVKNLNIFGSSSFNGDLSPVVVYCTQSALFFTSSEGGPQGEVSIGNGIVSAEKAFLAYPPSGSPNSVGFIDYYATPNRAAFFNDYGGITPSKVTNVELNYLSGSTGSIQNQLNGKLNSNVGLTATRSFTDSANSNNHEVHILNGLIIEWQVNAF